ncbi:hypothetical protein KSP40_PGU017452 [Platanthera guangdongensis]|uniref:Uncharacterized protein n=1 Tax=Platanthera guangdongensis TaxID=2320717 RepID=A0ABR2MZN4_9ASPA
MERIANSAERKFLSKDKSNGEIDPRVLRSSNSINQLMEVPSSILLKAEETLQNAKLNGNPGTLKGTWLLKEENRSDQDTGKAEQDVASSCHSEIPQSRNSKEQQPAAGAKENHRNRVMEAIFERGNQIHERRCRDYLFKPGFTLFFS